MNQHMLSHCSRKRGRAHELSQHPTWSNLRIKSHQTSSNMGCAPSRPPPKCKKDGCQRNAHPTQGHGYCCYGCSRGWQCGPLCTGVHTTICWRAECPKRKHPREGHGYCCWGCKNGTGCGPNCTDPPKPKCKKCDCEKIKPHCTDPPKDEPKDEPKGKPKDEPKGEPNEPKDEPKKETIENNQGNENNENNENIESGALFWEPSRVRSAIFLRHCLTSLRSSKCQAGWRGF